MKQKRTVQVKAGKEWNHTEFKDLKKGDVIKVSELDGSPVTHMKTDIFECTSDAYLWPYDNKVWKVDTENLYESEHYGSCSSGGFAVLGYKDHMWYWNQQHELTVELYSALKQGHGTKEEIEAFKKKWYIHTITDATDGFLVRGLDDHAFLFREDEVIFGPGINEEAKEKHLRKYEGWFLQEDE